MISFGPTEEQELAREAMREFAGAVLRPAARGADEAEALPDGLVDQVWELGLLATQIPEAYGGLGEPRSPLTYTLVLESLAYGDPALALAATSPATFALPILDQGTEAQRERFLPRFAGETFQAASLALVEPRPVFDPASLATTAEPKDGGFVLSGTKSFVPLADRASHVLVVARNTASAREGIAALDAFIVATDAPGLTVGAREKKLGLRGLPTFGLHLEEVEVDAADRLGGEGGIDAARLLAQGRTAVGAALVGLSCAVMDYAIPYAKEREAFDEAIAKKQAIAFMLSDMRVETDAMRWMVWKAASRLEQGLDPTRAAHLARGYAAEQAMKIADNGLQVLGGHGYIREHPVEMWYRHARTLSVLEGTVAV